MYPRRTYIGLRTFKVIFNTVPSEKFWEVQAGVVRKLRVCILPITNANVSRMLASKSTQSKDKEPSRLVTGSAE